MSRPGHVFDVMARLQSPGCSRQARAYGWEGASARIDPAASHRRHQARDRAWQFAAKSRPGCLCKARNFPWIAQGTPQSSSI